jgi:hypothetical protein
VEKNWTAKKKLGFILKYVKLWYFISVICHIDKICSDETQSKHKFNHLFRRLEEAINESLRQLVRWIK